MDINLTPLEAECLLNVLFDFEHRRRSESTWHIELSVLHVVKHKLLAAFPPGYPTIHT